MFKDYSIHSRVVKNPKPEPASEPREPRPRMDPLMINALILEDVRRVALLVGGAFVAKKLVETASEIAIVVAKAKF